MRVLSATMLLLVASVSAATVHEYHNKEWKRLIVSAPRPEYPIKARRLLMTGSGYFRLRFARDGHVISVTALQSTGHNILDAAAISAFKRWRLKPGPRRELDNSVIFEKSSPTGAWPSSERVPKTVLREFDD